MWSPEIVVSGKVVEAAEEQSRLRVPLPRQPRARVRFLAFFIRGKRLSRVTFAHVHGSSVLFGGEGPNDKKNN